MQGRLVDKSCTETSGSSLMCRRRRVQHVGEFLWGHDTPKHSESFQAVNRVLAPAVSRANLVT